MVGIGIVGIGFMGMIHYLAAQGRPAGKWSPSAAAIAKKLAGDWTSIQGNFGPRGTADGPLGRHARYRRLRRLLADPRVDLVDLCVPNDAHARMAIRALEAGKHVLVEKPIALTTADADLMVAAARAAGKLLMVGACAAVLSRVRLCRGSGAIGRYGALQAAHLMRVISKPDWSSGIADPTGAAGRRSTCTSTIPISSAWFAACRGPFTRGAWSREMPSSICRPSTSTTSPNLAVTCVSGCIEPVGTAVHSWLRVLSRAGDACVRVRQPGRSGARGHAALGHPPGRNRRPAGARLGRSHRRLRRRADAGRGGGGHRERRSRTGR